MGSDLAQGLINALPDLISIHAPRMGSDLLVVSSISSQQFQSTLPGWGATGAMGVERRHERISIHAPRMGSDSAGRWVDITTIPFQSTLPGWGATAPCRATVPAPSNFNPRSPDGERHGPRDPNPRYNGFQSTLPGWGATSSSRPCRCRGRYFNPRSPDGERLIADKLAMTGTEFQSTLPGWGATWRLGVRIRA